ncbi:hypothetical protein QN357_13480, partial [Cryobacterium sp. RTC2.1]|uniref:hypothetical protein n=1 Tax=Cryobacterium sp. RTC2.1 TaxID=3048634 RepID=UPI002B233A5A
RFYERKRPGVGNFSEQNWGISVSAVRRPLRGHDRALFEVPATLFSFAAEQSSGNVLLLDGTDMRTMWFEELID